MKDSKGAYSHNILNWCKNYSYFSQLLNVHNVGDVKQIEVVHTAEPLVPASSRLDCYCKAKKE
jgi:hypothetical protein